MIGAAKSGTTTLFHFLSAHPDIFFPIAKKEPFYFSFGNNKPNYSDKEFTQLLTWKTEDYLKLYENAPENKLLFDGSTSYLYTYEKTIENIKSTYGNDYKKLKITAILRNPADRAYSHFTYLHRNGFETLSFEKAIEKETIEKRKSQRWGFDYLEYGLYAKQIKAFKENFTHFKVLLFEDLKEHQKMMNDVFNFLDIEKTEIKKSIQTNPSGFPTNKRIVNSLRKNAFLKKTVNLFPEQTKMKLLSKRDAIMKRFLKKEKMNEKTREKLIAYYSDDIQELSKIIDRDLTEWM